jgi:hypothetical protein
MSEHNKKEIKTKQSRDLPENDWDGTFTIKNVTVLTLIRCQHSAILLR